jgi:hypothetical protein
MRYMYLINWKETLPLSTGRKPFRSMRGPFDWKAFLLVNLAGRNPSWPQDCTVLSLGGVCPSFKALREGKYQWCQMRYLVPIFLNN